jgi:hypothetical protein
MSDITLESEQIIKTICLCHNFQHHQDAEAAAGGETPYQDKASQLQRFLFELRDR